MPGNELGDRVHNFFAQDNSSQGQHQSHALEGNWPVNNSNFWVGSPRQIDVLNSTSKNFSSQNSEIDRGQPSYPVHAAHGLNFSQSNPRPDFSKSQSLNDQQYSNGFMYGNQFYQNRQNEANFLAVDTESEQRHLIASRGFSVHELQQGSGHEQQHKAPDRPEASVPPVSFDLFGGQQQMSHQQASMLQALQRQQSGMNDMQQLQKQLMLRKMQELQRQGQLQQLDLGHQNLINQVPPSTRQVSGSQPPLVNGTPNSDALRYPWTAEPSTNWLTRGSSAMQGTPAFPSNPGQTQRLMDLVPQQVDQSLYGVPVSNSRGLAVNQYPQMASMPQLATSSNSLHGNQHNFLPGRTSGQEGTSKSRQKSQNENSEHASSQSLNTGIMEMGFLQQVNSLQKNPTQQDFAGRQELGAQSDISHERSRMQVSSPRDEATLDATEEKILFGSDDNIWAAFGKSPNTSPEAGNLFDTGAPSNGFSSVQSGSWSALMQSAVAETSSNDIAPQEEWSGLIFHNTDGSSTNQFPSVHSDNVKQVSLPNALTSGPIPPSNINTVNPMGLNQLGDIFQKDSSERVPTDISQRFGQSFEEASQIHGNASQNSLDAERNAKTISAMWTPGQSGTRPQPNGWSALAAVPSGGDRVLNMNETKKESQNSQSNHVRVMQGEGVHESSLWKSSSAMESGPVRSVAGNRQTNKGILSLHDTTSSVSNSYNMGVGDGTNPFVQNNYLLNQWKNASPAAKFQGGESLGRMMDQVNEQNQGSLNSYDREEVTRYNRENSAMKENSNDSHHSNMSRHASGGFRDSGLSDASDSRSLPSGKQKPSNQLSSKVSVSRKFQYHPMGNLDEDVEPTHGLNQPNQVQTSPLQNAHFGQSKLFGQVSRNSVEKGELPKDYKGPDKEPSGGFPGYILSAPVPLSRPFDSYTNKASSPSQNMLELLHKVDQPRDLGSVMHLSSSDCNVSSQLPEAEQVDGSAQPSQCFSSQGFGLQLGPPSQLLQNPDLSSPSRNAQGTISSIHTSHAGAEMGEKGLLTVPTSTGQSLPFSNEESQTEYKRDRSSGPGHPGTNNSLYMVPGNHYPAFSSDNPYARSQLQNKQMTRVSGKVATNKHTDSSVSCNTPPSMQRGSAETVLTDASGNLQKDLASSVVTAQQAGRYGVQEMDPAGTASTRDQMRGSQSFGLPGISRQGGPSQLMHNMWTNVPTSQHTLAGQYPKAPSHLSELPQPNILESGSQGEFDDSKGGHISSKSGAILASSPFSVDGEERRLKESSGQLATFVNVGAASKTEVPLRRALPIKNHLDDSPANSASRQKDIEAFGRSLKPNIFSNEKFALLNQMRALKDAECDPNIRISKRMKVPDNMLDIHQANLTTGKQNDDNVGDSLGSGSGVPSEDSRMMSFSTHSDALDRNTSPHGNAASEDIVAAGRPDSQSSHSTDSTAVRVEHHPVSPQMAPSWFNQYGSFKNWQTLPMHNAQNVPSLRPGESPVTLGKSSIIMDAPNLEDKSSDAPVDACPVDSTLQNSAPISEGNEHLTPAQSLQQNATGQHQVVLRPKKRNRAELHPWYKEISDGSLGLSILSVAETDWSEATNHLTEKVGDDVELIEDGPPLLRSKRRLIMTAQLMQQLLSPPPAAILSTDASSEYESVAYAVSRVALGDACSALSSSNSMGLPCDGVNLHVKGKHNGDPRFAKAIEDLWGKARKLENDFLRLDKSASILDLRLECQDLEKFSVINRFAKFHGRGQSDNAETSSTDATATAYKSFAQRYATAVPAPRSLPDRVQCLSL
ncbi:hypothetical protein ACS0TY_006728 [Phlomoides rotata]